MPLDNFSQSHIETYPSDLQRVLAALIVFLLGLREQQLAAIRSPISLSPSFVSLLETLDTRMLYSPFSSFMLLQQALLSIAETENNSLQTAIDESFAQSTLIVTPIAEPLVSKNETRINEIQAELKALGASSIDIPEEYLCSLSNEIMTVPVYKSTSHVNVEQVKMLHWLQLNKTNPYNRLPLSPAELIVNMPLKRKIDAFFTAAEAMLKREKKAAEKAALMPAPAILNGYNDKKRSVEALMNEESKAAQRKQRFR